MMNRIGCVKVFMLASSAVDRGFEPRSGQTKDYNLVCVASPLITQHYGDRADNGWPEVKIMCPSGSTYLSADYISVSLQ